MAENYLNKTGLAYFWGKLKALFGSSLSATNATVTLKSKSGGNLSSVTVNNVANATKAGQLTTARTIELTGDVTGSVNFDGSTNVSIATTLGGAAGVDSSLSTISTAAVQNKVITEALAGKFPTFTKSTYNCDLCYDAGLYQVGSGANCPSGSQFGSLFVWTYRKISGNTTPDYCVQIFLPNGDDATKPNAMFYRTSLSGSWNPWQDLGSISNSEINSICI